VEAPASAIESGRVRVLNGTTEPPFTGLFDPATTESAIVVGDAATVLADVPSGVFQACVTSPPYWSLRNSEWGARGLARVAEHGTTTPAVVIVVAGCHIQHRAERFTTGRPAAERPDGRQRSFRML
jgi:hypothetical protein